MFETIEFYENEDIKKHNTFKIGAYARYFVLPKNINELKKVVNICKKHKLKYLILGNGSNLLFNDKPYNGVIISLKKFNSITIKNNLIKVDSGANLAYLNHYLAKNNLSGLEWSYGIPATIGGATKMNAGAFGHCIFEYIVLIKMLINNKIVLLNKFDYSYRNSNLPEGIILSVYLKTTYKTEKQIFEKMNTYLKIRKENQPHYPSAGSVFKRSNIIPAKIIDNMGLKGLSVGGAEISKKHAGFIINKNNATNTDISTLIKIIKAFAKYNGYKFDEEIIKIT